MDIKKELLELFDDPLLDGARPFAKAKESIRIGDKGPGVKEEEIPLLKEKYRRGSNTNEKDGAGLGLYLANYFMEKMDGQLGLSNKEPGFEVSVYLRII